MRLKKLFLFLLVISSFYAPKVVASDFSSCCCSPCDDCCSGWTIYADWLYWRTRRCELDYAIPFDEGTGFIENGSVFDVEPRYDHGFRVGIKKECGCFFFDAFYTYFRNRERDSVTDPAADLAGTRVLENPIGNIEQGAFTFASGDWRIRYDTLDILAGYTLSDCCCFQTYAFGGFKFARIDQRFEIEYSGSTELVGAIDEVTERIDMRAYGVDLGFGFTYDILSCFNFFGRFSYDVLLGDIRRRFLYETTPGLVPLATTVDLRDQCWRMVSVFNLTFGLGYNYHFCNCCLSTLGIAIGYEFHQWVNVPDFLDHINDTDIVTFDRHLQSLGFDGLFVRASIGF